jgi:hypothetical protein
VYVGFFRGLCCKTRLLLGLRLVGEFLLWSLFRYRDAARARRELERKERHTRIKAINAELDERDKASAAKGATLQHSGWASANVGFIPFPTGRLPHPGPASDSTADRHSHI